MAQSDYPAWVAGLYDHSMDVSFDVPFFLEEARKTSGGVPELMSGTGRVSLPLIEAGIPLTCLDNAPEMLDRPRARRRDAAPVGDGAARPGDGDRRGAGNLRGIRPGRQPAFVRAVPVALRPAGLGGVRISRCRGRLPDRRPLRQLRPRALRPGPQPVRAVDAGSRPGQRMIIVSKTYRTAKTQRTRRKAQFLRCFLRDLCVLHGEMLFRLEAQASRTPDHWGFPAGPGLCHNRAKFEECGRIDNHAERYLSQVRIEPGLRRD